jgi:GTP cyclohydrolase II
MEYIAKKGYGAILYLDQEGRGIGLAEKIKAYSMQDKGMDTIEANLAINQPVDARTFDFAIAVLKQLNLKSVELITNNPKKLDSLKSIFTNDSIKMYNIVAGVTNENKDYLDVKRSKMNHKLKF